MVLYGVLDKQTGDSERHQLFKIGVLLGGLIVALLILKGLIGVGKHSRTF